MKVSEIMSEIGNIDIPDKFLKMMGLIDEDRMMNAEEVQKKLGLKDITSAYRVIKKLKFKYGCKYEDAKIAKSIFDEYYKMK